MAKAASATAKRESVSKKAATSIPSRSRTVKRAQSSLEPSVEMGPDPFELLQQRFTALEAQLTHSLANLTGELQALKSTLGPSVSPEGSSSTETLLPVIADLIRRHLMEHLAPVSAALKRLEERIGFVSNRLKHGGSGQDRQKPWRHDQQRHSRPKGHNGPPRPTQGQPWSPPSAASVQGHFAPRPLNRDESVMSGEEDD
jgi:hypothetical protein